MRKTILALAAILSLAACGPEPSPRPVVEVTAQPGATPTAVASVTVTRRPTLVPSPSPTRSSYDGFLDKPGDETLRLMSYNVGWDSIFDPDDPLNHELREGNRVQSFVRIMRAVNPDIVCLQEINERRAETDLLAFINRVMQADGGNGWQVVHVRDTLITSHLDLVERGFQLETRTVLPNLDQAAALVDLPDDSYGRTDLYLICTHFKAGGGLADILLRVRQADAIMAHLRDFRMSGGPTRLSEGTPFVILGDFNIYDTDPARHFRTLVHGDIEDQGRYGEDWDPDWDGSPLRDARPSHNGLGEDYYTWRMDLSPFNPRALDRIIYSDSVLTVKNAFVLNTLLMSDEILALHDLEREDVLFDPETGTYDHLPVVVDFSIGDAE